MLAILRRVHTSDEFDPLGLPVAFSFPPRPSEMTLVPWRQDDYPNNYGSIKVGNFYVRNYRKVENLFFAVGIW